MSGRAQSDKCEQNWRHNKLDKPWQSRRQWRRRFVEWFIERRNGADTARQPRSLDSWRGFLGCRWTFDLLWLERTAAINATHGRYRRALSWRSVILVYIEPLSRVG